MEVKRDERTPLHIACENDNLPIVQHLIEKGANLESKDKFERTPIQIAADQRHRKIVNYLFFKGAKYKKCSLG